MIKYYGLDYVSSLFKLDTEKDTVNTVNYIRSNIDWVYRIPEDGFIIKPDGSKIKVNANDIVLKMYAPSKRYSDPKEYIIVKDKEIVDYYFRYFENVKKSEEKEENSCKCSCELCENCDPCGCDK